MEQGAPPPTPGSLAGRPRRSPDHQPLPGPRSTSARWSRRWPARSLAAASPSQKAVRLSSNDLSTGELDAELPGGLKDYLGRPVSTASVSISVVPPGGQSVATRLYAAIGGLSAAPGRRRRRARSAAGEVMVSSGDVADERLDRRRHRWRPESGSTPLFAGKSVRRGPGDHRRVSTTPDPRRRLARCPAHRSGRPAGPGRGGSRTDDWVTVEDTLLAATSAKWHRVTSSVAWPLDTVDHDDLLEVGPIVSALPRRRRLEQRCHHLDPGRDRSARTCPSRSPTGSDQGRTTVVVLVAQLLVLVGGGALDGARRGHRRPALRAGAGAAARPRSPRGRRIPARRAVAAHPERGGGRRARRSARDEPGRPGGLPGRRCRTSCPGGFLLAALGSAVAVLLVVLAASRRAVREPVDSLLRAVQARHAGTGAGAAEITMIVFSLTAVVALVTGNLEGPLATLAPTLLAVAVGLLLGRGAGPGYPSRLTAAAAQRDGRWPRPASSTPYAARRPAGSWSWWSWPARCSSSASTRWSPGSRTGRTPPSRRTAPPTR